MTDIQKTLLHDRQSSDAAVTAIIQTAVAAAAAMAVAAATAVVVGPGASTIAATAVADNGRLWAKGGWRQPAPVPFLSAPLLIFPDISVTEIGF